MSHQTLPLFDDLATLFDKHGFKLYMVGGTSRDFLLKRVIVDYDFATDATPDEMETFLLDANYRFRNFGTVSLKYLGEHVEITTLRTEGEYTNYRHPGKITFVKTPAEDYIRRDFTINALYLTKDYEIIDYTNGLRDLENNYLRMIGNPYRRIEEDPLRIIRAFRFLVKFDLKLDAELETAIIQQINLLDHLNPEKIKAERHKVAKGNLAYFDEIYYYYTTKGTTH